MSTTTETVRRHLLTSEQEAQVARDGYIVMESVFDAGEVAGITDACEDLVAKLAADRSRTRYKVGSYCFDPDAMSGVVIKWEGDTDVVHGLEPFVHLSEELEACALDGRFVDPMVTLTGSANPCLFTEKLNLKRAIHGGPNPWHQDFPYWEGANPHAATIATAMLFLDDATLENGALQVLPGSHRRGKWQTRADTDSFGNLEMDPATLAGAKPVAVEVPAGSVVYFGAFLVHMSLPNTSERDRRSLLFSYQPDGHPHSIESMRFADEARRTAKERRAARIAAAT